jgi:hypothetical protein
VRIYGASPTSARPRTYAQASQRSVTASVHLHGFRGDVVEARGCRSQRPASATRGAPCVRALPVRISPGGKRPSTICGPVPFGNWSRIYFLDKKYILISRWYQLHPSSQRPNDNTYAHSKKRRITEKEKAPL